MVETSLDKFIELRIMAMIEDHDLIKRTMQHNFVALTEQNLGFSMRCGQKQELMSIEKDGKRPVSNMSNILPIDINSLKL